jgi:hypothetical protein
VLVVQEVEADKAINELLRKERDLARRLRSTRRYKHSPDELARLLAEVPF